MKKMTYNILLSLTKSNQLSRARIALMSIMCLLANNIICGQIPDEKENEQAETANSKETAENLKAYFSAYKNPDANTDVSRLKESFFDDKERTVFLYADKGFEEQHFTESTVSKVYADIKQILKGTPYRNYKVKVISDGKPIEELIPNMFRHGNKATDRIWESAYKGHPWVINTSATHSTDKGLANSHIALWQSHGRYFDKDKGWKWQRPRLFCSTEDLLSQTFVIPYIIPMLQNAGAVVFTPRERDWQSNECIVDNDNPNSEGTYSEKGHWLTYTEAKGFAKTKDTYYYGDNPFTDGTSKYTSATSDHNSIKTVTWYPNIPEEGKYAVYVSYPVMYKAIPDAQYTVVHKGVETKFEVNQQMGGGTWVYIGTFDFEKDMPERNKVTLSNMSRAQGTVGADAVRFGGGMGNISRGNDSHEYSVSGMPRWAEASRYSMQWAGMPDSVYSYSLNENDYKDDINSRSFSSNLLSGRSIYNPDTVGRNVPFELSMAFHTDAGFRRDDSFFGSLSICSTGYYDGQTSAGLSRFASHDLASALLTNLRKDLKRYKWDVRKLWDRNYSETREPQIPSVILEMLSHQNFHDMEMAYDPWFKFYFSRSVYKTVTKYIAESHNRDCVIQPLPVRHFSVETDERHKKVKLTWKPTVDPLESTAVSNYYIVYTKKGENSFDNGRRVQDNEIEIDLEDDYVYSFYVCAGNSGGISFPSETLTARIKGENSRNVLIVNCFNRLSAPYSFNNETEQGFSLQIDPGVQYGAFAGFCGDQRSFNKANIGSEATTGLGWSGSELEGKVIMGNTFNYPTMHAEAMRKHCNVNVSSISEDAFITMSEDIKNLDKYDIIDVIYGTQKEFNPHTSAAINDFCCGGKSVFVSGANIMKDGGININALHIANGGKMADDRSTGITGSGLNFNIYREMNDKSYSVPAPDILQAIAPAFPMLIYANSRQAAAVAFKRDKSATITLGFPFETIQEKEQRELLMAAVIKFLTDKK